MIDWGNCMEKKKIHGMQFSLIASSPPNFLNAHMLGTLGTPPHPHCPSAHTSLASLAHPPMCLACALMGLSVVCEAAIELLLRVETGRARYVLASLSGGCPQACLQLNFWRTFGLPFLPLPNV